MQRAFLTKFKIETHEKNCYKQLKNKLMLIAFGYKQPESVGYYIFSVSENPLRFSAKEPPRFFTGYCGVSFNPIDLAFVPFDGTISDKFQLFIIFFHFSVLYIFRPFPKKILALFGYEILHIHHRKKTISLTFVS